MLSLSEARHVRDEAKRILISDVDPAHDRKLNKVAAAKYTFRSIAEEYVDKLKKEGRADTTIISTNSRMGKGSLGLRVFHRTK